MANWWDKDRPKGILVPKETKYKGYPVLSIPVDEDGQPMTFGVQEDNYVI